VSPALSSATSCFGAKPCSAAVTMTRRRDHRECQSVARPTKRVPVSDELTQRVCTGAARISSASIYKARSPLAIRPETATSISLSQSSMITRNARLRRCEHYIALGRMTASMGTADRALICTGPDTATLVFKAARSDRRAAVR
jgi:hypothetical protein